MAVKAKKCEIKRYRRLSTWDYSGGASFFITIATEPRRPLFGTVERGVVALSPLGEMVKESLEAMPRLNPGLRLFGHVVMPDHVHFNCSLAAGLDAPLKVLGWAVRRFKNYTTKLAKRSLAIDAGVRGTAYNHDGQTGFGQSTTIWQQGYHDYILVSREMIDATERYIAYNPLKWELMYGEEGALRVAEPLFLPRLDPGDYWKGVGNLALLDPTEKLVSLRVSREVAAPEAIAAVVRRLERAVDKGYIVVSGFISKGERAVCDMLCRRPDARFVRVLPSCLPNRRFRPESCYVAPFAEGRDLEIAKGNDEVEFGRRACLDVNAEIIEIATAGEGLSLYWKADGPKVVASGQCVMSDSVRAVAGILPSGVDVEQEIRNHAIEKYLRAKSTDEASHLEEA